MPFLDVPSAAPTPSSFLLDENKLAAGRPQPATELTEANVILPGGSRRDNADSAGLRSEVITPVPTFVLKSSLDEAAIIHVPSESSSPTFPKGTKLFINVAHHALLPEPPKPPPAASVDDLWIPAVVGEMAVTIDRAGKTSLVVDIVFHTSVTEKAKREANYKLFLIQVVLEKVEDKYELELSRDYGLPKTFSSKGPLLPRTVVLPSKGPKPLITPSTAPPARVPPTSDANAPPPSSMPTAKDDAATSPWTAKLEHTLTFPSPSSFLLLVHLPIAVAAPPEGAPAPPATALQLLPPRTLALTLSGAERFSVDIGESQVDPQGLEAEWRVAESVLRVSGRLIP